MDIDIDALRMAISRIAARLEDEQERLNRLDGQLGDGDLGITLVKAFRQLEASRGELPADLGQALMQCASAVARVSSSSFGTLLATGLIAAGKEAKGKASLPATEIPHLLSRARDAMAARGRSDLGDKTVLDAMDAAARVEFQDSRDMLPKMRRAVEGALDEYRRKPNRVGRARIFAERSVGVDDPGMDAFAVMLDAIGERA